MYEDQTYEALLERMLDRVPEGLDKREGSIIYDALAPAAAELAQMYVELEVNNNLFFPDTAEGEYLERSIAWTGITRQPAGRRSLAPSSMPAGTYFWTFRWAAASPWDCFIIVLSRSWSPERTAWRVRRPERREPILRDAAACRLYCWPGPGRGNVAAGSRNGCGAG